MRDQIPGRARAAVSDVDMEVGLLGRTSDQDPTVEVTTPCGAHDLCRGITYMTSKDHVDIFTATTCTIGDDDGPVLS